MPFDQLAQRYAHGFFYIARRIYMAGQAENLGAGISRPPNPGKPGCTAAQDLRNHRDRFNIVDGARAPVEPDLGREGRFQAWLTFASFETLEKASLLAADVCTCPAVQVEIKAIAGAAGVLSDQPRGIGLVDRRLQTLGLVIELTPNINVAIMHPHPGRGQQAPFYELMRFVAQDVAIFARAWFAFISIDDEIGRPVALFRHKRPLQAGRKAGPAAPAQPRFFDLLDDPLTALQNEVLGAVPIAASPGPVEPPVALAVQVGEDAITVGEHRLPFIRAKLCGRRRARTHAARSPNRAGADSLRAARRAIPPSPARRGPRRNRR